MVNERNESTLFTSRNLSQFAERKCKLLYTILSEAIPGTDGEHSTIGLALTPEDACEMCSDSMGDAIEVWVIDGEKGILSEKWEPAWFKEHFNEVVEYSRPGRPGEDGGEEDDEDPLDSNAKEPKPGEEGGFGMELPPGMMLSKALVELLEYESHVSRLTVATSYATGHPLDLDALLEKVHESICDIVKAFAGTKGGYEPKFRRKNGVLLPYWTKTQIKQAHSSKKKSGK